MTEAEEPNVEIYYISPLGLYTADVTSTFVLCVILPPSLKLKTCYKLYVIV